MFSLHYHVAIYFLKGPFIFSGSYIFYHNALSLSCLFSNKMPYNSQIVTASNYIFCDLCVHLSKLCRFFLTNLSFVSLVFRLPLLNFQSWWKVFLPTATATGSSDEWMALEGHRKAVTGTSAEGCAPHWIVSLLCWTWDPCWGHLRS